MTESKLSAAVATPDHVPASLVYDFDYYHDPALCADPHMRVMDLLKSAPPIFWTPRNNGHWVLAGHSANFEAARDVEAFSSEIFPRDQMAELLAQLEETMGRIPLAVPINLDPPMHTKYRQPLQKVFSPKTINALSGSIRALAVELIDEIVDKGQCEFMTAMAEPLPVQVFLKMLGLPLERLAEYRELVSEHLSSVDSSNAILTMQKVVAAMRDTIIERRDNPQDDILSMLWKVEIDGAPVSLEDMENYAILLFIAGLDTVMQGMGHGFRHLALNPDLQDELRAEPEKIKQASEEMLRRYTFTVPPRRVSRDMEFQGVSMKKDERALLYLPAADLDAREFAEPDSFNMSRERAHIAFNAGPHRCLGSHLARVELQIVYEEFLARMPKFKLDPKRPPTFHGGHVLGVDTLHLVWEV
ncbi:cytochrome P450 [Zhongshania aquimaris]|uniref:Cytochrome P450 n=1 Tax=Zhongshania aquimaris TaxID=2857107 RepID=A0ABS6VXV6_9GAMM|nr:cytochrome P450 [Zhongshania aquimaris]MBW2942476.1 cytochrome P450 [Zhongshania aquimaris]